MTTKPRPSRARGSKGPESSKGSEDLCAAGPFSPQAREEDCVVALLDLLPWDEATAAKNTARAAALITRARDNRKSTDLENFFSAYGLDTPEGRSLMCLAEALGRIPDSATAVELISDKLSQGEWSGEGKKPKKTQDKKLQDIDGRQDGQDTQKLRKRKNWLERLARAGLSLSDLTLSGPLSSLSLLTKPAIRQAMGVALTRMGGHFVLAPAIEKALKEAAKPKHAAYRFSYDMLGEGARTHRDAGIYFKNYQTALAEIARDAASHAAQKTVQKQEQGETDNKRPAGLSVKLSALHPRYEFSQRDDCVPVLCDRLLQLCRVAREANLSLTVDAEESERLELGLEIFEIVFRHPDLQDWQGLGLAVQAYLKQAPTVIDRLAALAQAHGKRIEIRLVKGAYWDHEIKHAQLLGLSEFPVYTRKVNTDLSYLACAHKIIRHGDLFYPMFATHNAHTIVSILEQLDPRTPFELQKLFGMGDALYRALSSQDGQQDRQYAQAGEPIPVSVYAPVGAYRDLLPYLVRRLLENGANSSFVKQIADNAVPAQEIAADPVKKARENTPKSHPLIRRPPTLYDDRANSSGLDLDARPVLENLLADMQPFLQKSFQAKPMINGRHPDGKNMQDTFGPAELNQMIGKVCPAGPAHISRAFSSAEKGFSLWSATPAQKRAACLDRLADLLESHRTELIALCVREGGKTIPDSLDELREAVDFCRFYAARGRIDFAEGGRALQGPTGEDNLYRLQGRGIFVCISPWNFPLAIFTGQVAAALMAGNAVIAKPAEQTPLIAARIAALMIEAGIPPAALSLLPGDGRVGAALVQHPRTDGVAFTGSTETAQMIAQDLAAKKGQIVPFIAETGGQNAMIADSSALSEQLVDDVLTSAFGSAGQRCSACRILFVQKEIAGRTIEMLAGAMEALHVGNPAEITSDIGPVIDAEALAVLQHHKSRLEGIGRKIAQAPLDEGLRQTGTYFAPCAYEIESADMLEREVFGPVLHVVRYDSGRLDAVIAQINATGYGLTLGIHSRIDSRIDYIKNRVRAGNIYVNRSMTGAVVGVQPFGGQGLSGTGPKAGGPLYLPRFATEQSISTDITAGGGNAPLVNLAQ